MSTRDWMDNRKIISEPWVLDDSDGWARFPCGGCGKQLHVGDEVVLVRENDYIDHPQHADRRRCR